MSIRATYYGYYYYATLSPGRSWSVRTIE